MGLIFNRGNNQGCSSHHFPDEYEETNTIDVVTHSDIDRHQPGGFDNKPFDVKIYRERKKRCLHDGCRAVKNDWILIASLHRGDFLKMIEFLEDYDVRSMARQLEHPEPKEVRKQHCERLSQKIEDGEYEDLEDFKNALDEAAE